MNSENKPIEVTDAGQDSLIHQEGSSELVMVSADQFQVLGLSDIWGLIGNALRLNLISHARALFDMLVANPGKHTVADLIAEIKSTIADISGQTTPAPVGPPKLGSQPVLPGEFALAASRKEIDEIREELERRGVKNVKAIPIMVIFGIAQMLIRYGPGIWEKIMELINRKKAAAAADAE